KKENNGFRLVRKDSSIFQALNNFNKFIWNVQAAWTIDMAGWTEVDYPDPYVTNPIGAIPSVNSNTRLQEAMVNIRNISIEYGDYSIVSQSEVFKVYDTGNGNLKVLTTIKSNGDTSRTYYTYVADLASTTSSDTLNWEINWMQYLNMPTTPIEI